MALRDFFKRTLKIALAIFLSTMALAGVVWGVMEIRSKNERIEAEQHEVAKTWRKDLKDYLQLDLTARTKLVDGRLLVAVRILGFPEYLSHPRLSKKNDDAQILLIFEDKDGFKQFEKGLKISELSVTVDAKGKKIGLHHQFEDHLSVARYKSFAQVNVQWTLETEIPPEPKVAATPPQLKPTASNTQEDHCAPGLSKAERLRRLAKHGAVRESGQDRYAVGYREVAFFPETIGGGLLSCR